MPRRHACLAALAAAFLLTACSGDADVAPTKDRLLDKPDLPSGSQLTYPDLAGYQKQNTDQLDSVKTDPQQCTDLIKSIFRAGSKGVVLGAVGQQGQVVETLTAPNPGRVDSLRQLTQQCGSVTTSAGGQSATAHYTEFDTGGVRDADNVYGIKVTNDVGGGTPSVAVLIVAERNGVGMTMNVSSPDESEPDRIALTNKALSKLDG